MQKVEASLDPLKVNSVLQRELVAAAEYLRRGELVAFPTETVYGLGADATSTQAVAAIFEAKQRPEFDPLIVHLPNTDRVREIVTEFPEMAERLAERFWPGPLTMVLPRKAIIPDLVTSGLPGVGVRVPNHPVALALLELAGVPVAAPSANPFGRISPTTADHVRAGLGNRVQHILDGGPCQVGLESTVISLMKGRPVILRPGGCSLEAIQDVIGPVESAAPISGLEDRAQPAPGMLSRHYAPGIPLKICSFDQTAVARPGLRCGLLTDGGRSWKGDFQKIEMLSAGADLTRCAANFFASLRNLDLGDLDLIIAHEFPNHGLGVALNDRLRRAAAGSVHS
jgi:L-threonylcarbamoyladenylate synthase